MTSPTLTQAAELIQDDLVGGVVENIITVDALFSFLPFQAFTGQAIVVNREETLGDAGLYAVGDTITHTSPFTTTQVSFTPKKIIGEAQVDNLVQRTSKNAGVSQMAMQVASKAKRVGQIYQQGIATGDGTGNNLSGLHSLVDSSQYTPASAGQDLSFSLLRQLLNLVTIRNGDVDFITMHSATLDKYHTLNEALGGTTPMHVLNLPDGTTRSVSLFQGVPIFRNDYLPLTETAGGAATTGGNKTSVYAGCWDDGTRTVGVAGIYPLGVSADGNAVQDLGIEVEPIGTAADKDEKNVRVKWYTNFVCYSKLGLARLTSINV